MRQNSTNSTPVTGESNEGDVVSSTANDKAFVTDSPLEYLKVCFPNKKFPEKSLRDIQLRVLSGYIEDYHDLPLDKAIEKAGMTRLVFDILCIGMIDTEKDYLLEVQAEYKQVDNISDRTLYKNQYYERMDHDPDFEDFKY